MDSKKVKLIAAGVIGLLALIIIVVNLFGGSNGEEINEEALERLQNTDEPIGGPRMAPGADPDAGLPPE